jgi:hypothetical protein
MSDQNTPWTLAVAFDITNDGITLNTQDTYNTMYTGHPPISSVEDPLLKSDALREALVFLSSQETNISPSNDERLSHLHDGAYCYKFRIASMVDVGQVAGFTTIGFAISPDTYLISEGETLLDFMRTSASKALAYIESH